MNELEEMASTAAANSSSSTTDTKRNRDSLSTASGQNYISTTNINLLDKLPTDLILPPAESENNIPINSSYSPKIQNKNLAVIENNNNNNNNNNKKDKNIEDYNFGSDNTNTNIDNNSNNNNNNDNFYTSPINYTNNNNQNWEDIDQQQTNSKSLKEYIYQNNNKSVEDDDEDDYDEDDEELIEAEKSDNSFSTPLIDVKEFKPSSLKENEFIFNPNTDTFQSFHTPSASFQNLTSDPSEEEEESKLTEIWHESENIASISNYEMLFNSELEQTQIHDRTLEEEEEKNSHHSIQQQQNENNTNSNDNLLDESHEFPSFIMNSIINDLSKSISNSVSDLTQSVDSNISNLSREGKESSGGSHRGSKETLMTTSSGSKPSKKKNWYNVFTTSYKTRFNDFKRIFKSLPTEEKLIVDYSCALQREILLQGRMYISQNFISFYANIFGWETQTSIKFREIAQITKEKTALVIPNAIQISTDNEKFFFSSFVTRDSSYLMLFKLWQNALINDAMTSKEVWSMVHSCYGEELGVEESEDENENDNDELLDLLVKPSSPIVKAPSVSTLLSTNDETDDTTSLQIHSNEENFEIDISQKSPEITSVAVAAGVSLGSLGISKPTVLKPVIEANNLPTGVIIRTDISESSESEIENLEIEETIPFLPICPIDHCVGRETVNTILNIEIDQLFTMLFENSKFYLDLHTSRKTFDIVQSQWTQSESQKVRQVSFTVSLNHAMGPKHSQVTESQVMLPCSVPGLMYAIDCESVNAGIPYADSFYVTSHFCITKVSSHESRLVIINQVKFKKSVWGMKSFIEKNSWAGIVEFYKYLERALKDESEKMISMIPETPMISSKSSRQNSLPRRRVRKKYPAPDIPNPRIQLTRKNVINDTLPKILDSSINNSSRVRVLSENSSPQTIPDGTTVLKFILTILALLIVLNGFLYYKLTNLESSTVSDNVPPSLLFNYQSISLSKDLPQNHEEWLKLLQKQESLHRIELEKWHQILLSALKILNQAESDLESLKFHITAYSSVRFGSEGKSNSIKDSSKEEATDPINSLPEEQTTTTTKNTIEIELTTDTDSSKNPIK